MSPWACRGCLVISPRLYDLFKNDLYELFGEVLGNPIFELDELPQHICGVCYTQLMKYKSFRNRCKRVQHLLEEAQLKGIQVSTEYIKQIDRNQHNLLANFEIVKPQVDFIIQDESTAPDLSDQESDDNTADCDEPSEALPPSPIELLPQTQTTTLPQTQPLPQTLTTTFPQTQPLPRTLTSTLLQTQPLPQTQTITLPQSPPLPQTQTTSLPQTQPLPQTQTITLTQTQPLSQTQTTTQLQTQPMSQTLTTTLPQTQPLPQTQTTTLPQTQPLPQTLTTTEPQTQPLPQTLTTTLPQTQPLPQTLTTTLPQTQPLPHTLTTTLPKTQPLSQTQTTTLAQNQPLSQKQTKTLPQQQTKRDGPWRFTDDDLQNVIDYISQPYECTNDPLCKKYTPKYKRQYIPSFYHVSAPKRKAPRNKHIKSSRASIFDNPKRLEEIKQKYNIDILYLSEEKQREDLRERIRRSASRPLPYCTDCGRSFRNEENLQAHIKNEHDESAGTAVCELCKYRSSDQLMKKHLQIHRIRFACKLCNYVSTQLSSYLHVAINHAKTHNDGFVCKYCSSVFDNKDMLNSHILKKHSNELQWCKCCGETFMYLAPHMISFHRGILKNEYRCRKCGIKFATDDAITKHESLTCKDFNCVMCGIHVESDSILKQHVIDNHSRYKYVYELVLCTGCGVKFYGTESLERHLEEKSCGSGHPCQECGEGFPTAQAIDDHIVTTHFEKIYRICEKCDKVFDATDFRGHFELVHNTKPPQDVRSRRHPTRVWSVQGDIISAVGRRPERVSMRFICDACGVWYPNRNHLRYHMLLHTGETPYICDYCQKGFRGKRQLMDHINLHTGRKPYKCPHCPKAFKAKPCFHRHMLTHSSIRRHICNICGYRSITSTIMKAHIRQVHLHEPSKRRKRVAKKNYNNTDKDNACDNTDENVQIRKLRPRRKTRHKNVTGASSTYPIER